MSLDLFELDFETFLPLDMPGAVPAEKSKTQTEANDRGLLLIGILFFYQNAKQGFVLLMLSQSVGEFVLTVPDLHASFQPVHSGVAVCPF